MTKRLMITLEFVRSEQASDPYSFQFGVQKYLCRDANRHEYDEITLNWDEHLLGLLAQLQRPGVSVEVLAELGQRLTTFLAPAGIRAHEDRIVGALARGESVDVVLSSSAAELYSLPWELLRLRSTGQLLGEVPNLLIRHVWPGVKADVPEDPTGRLIVGWSAAGGAVPSRAHVAGISRAQGGHLEFDPERDVVADISLRTLDQRLATLRSEARAIHILCHGGADGLAFDAVDGMGRVIVDARMLQTLLAPYANDLSLVVICACHSGDGGTLGTRLGSAAQALHRAGVDTVVASRFPLSTSGSITLAETLYAELARNGGDVRSAFLQTKRALALDSGHEDLVSIQLYAHENALRWTAGGAPQPLQRHAPALRELMPAPAVGAPILTEGDGPRGAPSDGVKPPKARDPVGAAASPPAPSTTGRHLPALGRKPMRLAGAAVLVLAVLTFAWVTGRTPVSEPTTTAVEASATRPVLTSDATTSDTTTSDATTSGDAEGKPSVTCSDDEEVGADGKCKLVRCPEGKALDGNVCVPRCPEGTAFIAGGDLEEHKIDAFCMGITEVTVAEFRAQASEESVKMSMTALSRGSSRNSTKGWDKYCNTQAEERGDHPINCVAWNQADLFCKNKGEGWRLPTEWEWEWAARGREAYRKYPWGDEAPKCTLTVMTGDREDGCGMDRTWPVGSKPNGDSIDGLKDMYGNVWEWTSSLEGAFRARIRGGSWITGAPTESLDAMRSVLIPRQDRDIEVGFRCARSVR